MRGVALRYQDTSLIVPAGTVVKNRLMMTAKMSVPRMTTATMAGMNQLFSMCPFLCTRDETSVGAGIDVFDHEAIPATRATFAGAVGRLQDREQVFAATVD